ncbi:DUF2961 domain-containing protein [Brachybacterium sp. MASK1Z-5]|uniref:DUF2961 domain-containing protein n=1 Tax=Brachybacterium halotolerans TaxID=2795215 RepID=A0ABS1B9W6_9MICO|nr:glycoside hydrolase family 172 protein [Brachybacterium halotolerans]MBK0331459.1 DUF2961 domain-containing protein [Brachybacterium halotolerans]
MHTTPPPPPGPSAPDLTVLSDARTFSISAENPTGAPGQGGRAEHGEHETAWASRELPLGWKKSPCIDLPGRSTRTFVDVEGPGIIQHMWITVLPEHLRSLVLRVFWDDEAEPSIEVPLGDFFCQGWARFAPVTSQMVTVAPAGGLNCYWPMPFSRRARMEIENLSTEPVEGGEGLEAPSIFPTICGTGTEDYVGGAWAFEHPAGAYAEYSTPYLGMPQVIRPDGFGDSLTRFGLYRWHVPDPIRFRERIRVTVQALGFARPVDGRVRYRPLREDVATTAFWYQTEPHAPFVEDPHRQAPTWDGMDVT